MIIEFLSMNGYGIYVWSAFLFTLSSFSILYFVIKFQFTKEKMKFEHKFSKLNETKIKNAKKQDIFKEMLVQRSVSKI